jgi:hypothetical protein
MSAYDDAVAYLDSEVHPRCDYDIYSDMRDIVDEMEAENEKLRELVRKLYACNGSCHRCVELLGKCEYEKQLREFGIEVNGAPDEPMSDAARRVFERLMDELEGDSDESR